MLTVFPISKEVQGLAVEHKKEKITLAKPIIIVRELKDEEKIEKLNNLEKNKIQSDNNLVSNAKTKKPTRNKKPVTQEKIAVKNEPEQQTQKAVAYDKVFSLIQTGERALKNNSSVIKK